MDLLGQDRDDIVCHSALALRNLAIDENNKALIGKVTNVTFIGSQWILAKHFTGMVVFLNVSKLHIYTELCVLGMTVLYSFCFEW